MKDFIPWLSLAFCFILAICCYLNACFIQGNTNRIETLEKTISTHQVDTVVYVIHNFPETKIKKK